jgi:hypothetical protein
MSAFVFGGAILVIPGRAVCGKLPAQAIAAVFDNFRGINPPELGLPV